MAGIFGLGATNKTDLVKQQNDLKNEISINDDNISLFKTSSKDGNDIIMISEQNQSDAQAEVAECKQSATSIKGSIDVLQNRYDSLEVQLETLPEDQKAEIQAKMEEIENTIKEQQDKLDELNGKTTEAETKAEEAANQISAGQNQVTEANENVANETDDKNANVSALADVDKEISDAEKAEEASKETTTAGKMLSGIAEVYGTNKDAMLDKIAEANGKHILNEDGDGNDINDAAFKARAEYFSKDENDDRYYEKAQIYVEGKDVMHNSTTDKSLRNNTETQDAVHANDTATAVSSAKLIEDLGGVDEIAKESASHFGLNYDDLTDDQKDKLAYTVTGTLLQMSDDNTMINSKFENKYNDAGELINKDNTGIGFHYEGDEWELASVIEHVKTDVFPVQGEGESYVINLSDGTGKNTKFTVSPDSDMYKIFGEDKLMTTKHDESLAANGNDDTATYSEINSMNTNKLYELAYTKDDSTKGTVTAQELLENNMITQETYNKLENKDTQYEIPREIRYGGKASFSEQYLTDGDTSTKVGKGETIYSALSNFKANQVKSNGGYFISNDEEAGWAQRANDPYSKGKSAQTSVYHYELSNGKVKLVEDKFTSKNPVSDSQLEQYAKTFQELQRKGLIK